jgi:hypothetical protein
LLVVTAISRELGGWEQEYQNVCRVEDRWNNIEVAWIEIQLSQGKLLVSW